jgi:translation initiation factor 2 beta subunit (eIF-2beta)/eIF-5
MENQNQLYLTSDETVLLDPNYRYKICKLNYSYCVKKGTTITILENIETFSKELEVDQNLLINLIKKSLSVKIGLDKNTAKYYLQGKYAPQLINEIVYKFIKKCLLCCICDKPEVLIKHKKERLQQKCKACGNKDYLIDCEQYTCLFE